MTDDADASPPRAVSSATRVPDGLKKFDIWVCWNGHIKEPLAPWATGHLFPTKWGKGVEDNPDTDLDERPETDFETAECLCQIPAGELERLYSRTPSERGESTPVRPDNLIPTIILPHDPPDPPLMLVDLDDVRDPDTGEITPEAQSIIEQLDAYVEISSSGSGLHAFVRAALPEGLSRVIAQLDNRGHLELYDHGWMVGATWRHVADTPVRIPRQQEAVEGLLEKYVDRVPDGGHPTAEDTATPTSSRGRPEASRRTIRMAEMTAEVRTTPWTSRP